jgi:hypothetical protein
MTLPGTDLRHESPMDSGYSGLAAAIVISALRDVHRFEVATSKGIEGKKLQKIVLKKQEAVKYLLSDDAALFVSAAGINGPLTESVIEKAARDLGAKGEIECRP